MERVGLGAEHGAEGAAGRRVEAAEERAVAGVLPAGAHGERAAVAAAEGGDVDGVAEGVLGELAVLLPVAVAAGIGVDHGDRREPGGKRRLDRLEPGGERLAPRRSRPSPAARGRRPRPRRRAPARRRRIRPRRRSAAASCRRGGRRRRPAPGGCGRGGGGSSARAGAARRRARRAGRIKRGLRARGAEAAAPVNARRAPPFRPPCTARRGTLFGADDSARAPAPPHRRLRQPGHAADRPAPARVADLLRDPPLPEGRRRLPAGVPAAGGDPLRRPGERHRGRAARGRRRRSSPSACPVLGICYGQQAMMAQLGGKVEAGHHAEFGRAWVTPDRDRATRSSPASSRPAARRSG